MSKFIKKETEKPVLEAIQWNGKNFDEIMTFMDTNLGNKLVYENAEERALKTGNLSVRSDEGWDTAVVDDWIIRTDKGDYYVCHPEIFSITYDSIEGHHDLDR